MLLGGLTMTLSLALNLTPPSGTPRTTLHALLAILSGAALVVSAPPIFAKVFVRRVTLEQLFFIGLLGSYAASLYSSLTGVGFIYYEVVVILLAIYHFGQAFTSRQIARLSELERQVPGLRSRVRLIAGGGAREVAVSDVEAGQLIEVRPGEVIPIDGIIEKDAAFVEQLPHTGEPFPSPLEPGSPVLAGSKVLDGTIRVRTTSGGRERELDRLLASCHTSLPSPSASLADRVLRFFIPVVVLVVALASRRARKRPQVAVGAAAGMPNRSSPTSLVWRHPLR
jgi:cation transport ATPase